MGDSASFQGCCRSDDSPADDTAVGSGRVEAAEEFVAHRAEDDADRERGMFKRVRYSVRDAVRRMAEAIRRGKWTVPEMSDADVAALIQQAARGVRGDVPTSQSNGGDVRFSKKQS